MGQGCWLSFGCRGSDGREVKENAEALMMLVTSVLARRTVKAQPATVSLLNFSLATSELTHLSL